MSILIGSVNLIFLFVLSWWMWRKETSSVRNFFWPALIVKLGAGVVLGIIYSTYYTDSDTQFFFSEASKWANIAVTDPDRYFDYLTSAREGYFLGEARVDFIVKVTSFFAILTAGNYWVTSLYFSFLSFVSAWYLVKILARNLPNMALASVVAFLFFPSCVFWSAGIAKEALGVAGLLCVAAVFLQIWFNEKIRVPQILLTLLASWIGWQVKYFYFGLLIPVLIAAICVKYSTKRLSIQSPFSQATIFLTVLLLGFIAASFLHPNFSFQKIKDVLVENNIAFMQASSPDDVIHYYRLEPTWISLVMNSPWAFISGLYRPFVWEINSIMQGLASIENLGLLILTLLSIKFLPAACRSEQRVLLWACITFCTLLCIFLAISSPNFGTLVRYRIGFLPFFVLLICNHPFIIKPLSKLL